MMLSRRAFNWYLNYAWSFRRVRVLQFDLNGAIPDVPRTRGLEVKVLDPPLVDKLLEFHDTACAKEWHHLFDRTEVHARLRNGHFCYLGIQEQRIIAFHWFSPNTVDSPELGCRFGVNPLCVIDYNTYIHKPARGQNLSSALRAAAFRDFASKDCRRCYCYIRSDNTSALRSARKMAGTDCGTIYCGSLAGLRCAFLKTRSPDFRIVKKDPVFANYTRAFRRMIRQSPQGG